MTITTFTEHSIRCLSSSYRDVVLYNTLWHRPHYVPFTEKKAETQKGAVAGYVLEPGFPSRQLGSSECVLLTTMLYRRQ